ncbi:MAG TPA: DUF4271 domain-containing protein [Chitinophagaceae bacterium]|nr:DUF4271 domain-containing protein [Chitinophagaceae bacterium]
MRALPLLLLFALFLPGPPAQGRQAPADSGGVARRPESLLRRSLPSPAAPASFDDYTNSLMEGNSLFRHSRHLQSDVDPVRQVRSLDAMFYILFLLFLFLAVIRLVYHKYFSDLIRAFLNPTLSQRQLRDQLSQTPFPALLMNLFFTISLGIYLVLLLRITGFISNYNISLLLPSFVLLIGAVYTVKWLVLRFTGWIFAAEPLTEGYIFILFLIQKMLGIVLLPFLVILAFCSSSIAGAGFYISIIVISLFIVYRYVRAWGLIKMHISPHRFHFFLYFCAFEIIPVLILGKIVLDWLNGNA